MSITYLCSDGAMIPVPRDAKKFARFKAGTYYRLVEEKERSDESHKLFFKVVAHAWLNLPENRKALFASADHYRKFCLIKAGFRNEFVQPFDTEDAARAGALVVAVLSQQVDEFVVATVEGTMLIVYSARTQKMLKTSTKGMDKGDFEASKQAVMEICAHDIGVDVETLVREATK